MPTVSATISLQDALAHYGDVVDKDTIRDIHTDVRGNRREVCEQLTMLTGIDPPTAGSSKGSAIVIDGEDEHIREDTTSEGNDYMVGRGCIAA